MYIYNKIINTNLSQKRKHSRSDRWVFFQCLSYLFINILIKVRVHSVFH